MSFEDEFNGPMRDVQGDSGWAVSRECYTKEDAAELFEEAADEIGETIPAFSFMKTMIEGYAYFGFGCDDYGEAVHGWWWQSGEPSKKGHKKVWLAT